MAKLVLTLDLRACTSPATDAAAIALLDGLAREGGKACCFVSPESLPTLLQAGREGLAAAVDEHEVGLIHTVDRRGLARRPRRWWWDEFISLSQREVAAGSVALSQVFGAHPTALTMAPDSFLPQVIYAASQEGVAAVLGAPFEGDAAGLPLHYCGANLLATHATVGGARQPTLEASKSVLAACRGDTRVLVAALELPAAAQQDQRQTRTRMQTPKPLEFARFVDGCREDLGLELSCCGALFAEPEPAATLNPDHVSGLARQLEARLRPLEAAGAQWSPAEIFSALTQAGAQLARLGSVKHPVAPCPLLGPAEVEQGFGEILVEREALLRQCVRVQARAEADGRIPTSIALGAGQACPSAFLLAVAHAIVRPEAQIKVQGQPLPQYHATRQDVYAAAEGLADGWPGGLRGMAEASILAQCWTAK